MFTFKKGGEPCQDATRQRANADSRLKDWRAWARLHARLPLYRKRVAQTKRWLRQALQGAHGMAVSYSYGKDSTVLLHMVRSLDPTVPAVYVDQGANVPDTDAWRRDFPVDRLGMVDDI